MTYSIEQHKFYKWRCIKQDDEGKQHNLKMNILMLAYTDKVALKQWLRRIDEEVRHEGRITTEDALRKSEELRLVWIGMRLLLNGGFRRWKSTTLKLT